MVGGGVDERKRWVMADSVRASDKYIWRSLPAPPSSEQQEQAKKLLEEYQARRKSQSVVQKSWPAPVCVGDRMPTPEETYDACVLVWGASRDSGGWGSYPVRGLQNIPKTTYWLPNPPPPPEEIE